MKEKQGWKLQGIEIIKGMLMMLCSALGSSAYYPVLPAFFAVCSMNGKISLWVILGAVAGCLVFMSTNVILKYFFVLLMIGIGMRMYIWCNRVCSEWVAAIFASVSVVAMNYAGNAFQIENTTVFWTGILEGVFVFGLTLALHYFYGLPFQLAYQLQLRRDEKKCQVTALKEHQTRQMESFAYAVNGLSDAFFAMSQPKEKLVTEEVSALEQEITGRMCANCDACVLCWNENRMRRQGGIRALLHAVVNHSTRDELLREPYIEECGYYEGMVEAALQAFSRQELNYAWYNRLRENRYVVAKQLDAMAGLMEEWAKSRKIQDKLYRNLMVQIAYEVKEKGLIIEDFHIYEENHRLSVEGYVSSKWNGGVPAKQYVAAVEKAMKRPMRMGKEAKTVLTQEPVLITIYEDTVFYALQGIAAEKKMGSAMNGDSFSFFAMDDGSYHVCLSDGMGSGVAANQESEMVVDLLQKFIEAGFRKETAIQLMNSAMVLQGEENSFSTLDYGVINLYNGQLELIKIGGAVTFIKRGQQVESIEIGSLPAGADIHMEIESTKKQLGNGDFLVMLTDGVIEYLHVRNPKETLTDIIGGIQTDNAGVLAERILEQVLERTGGHARDDMTVLVTGIWEK